MSIRTVIALICNEVGSHFLLVRDREQKWVFPNWELSEKQNIHSKIRQAVEFTFGVSVRNMYPWNSVPSAWRTMFAYIGTTQKEIQIEGPDAKWMTVEDLKFNSFKFEYNDWTNELIKLLKSRDEVVDDNI